MTKNDIGAGAGKTSLARIAEMVNGVVVGDPARLITHAAPFDAAKADAITLAAEERYLKNIDRTAAGAVIVPRGVDGGKKDLIRVDNPRLAFAVAMTHFFKQPAPAPGVSPRAVVGPGFASGGDVSIGPGAVIGADVTMGDRVVVHPGVFVGDAVSLGSDVTLMPHVTVLERCRIGSRVRIQAGTVIGSDGFGFAPDGQRYFKIPQTGIVVIEDDVEIGANNTIDRATFGQTLIRQGVKTDNLVHIAHNVVVGENSVIVAQAGISGSVTIGRHAVLAGQVGISGHLTIGDNVTIGPQAGIAKSIQSGETISGTPGIPHRLWLRVQHIIPKLPELSRRIRRLEKQRSGTPQS